MTDFSTPEDYRLSKEFLDKGYVIVDANPAAITQLQTFTIARSCKALGDEDWAHKTMHWLNDIRQYVSPEGLNDYRLSVFNALNAMPIFRHIYYMLAPYELTAIVGNELAMQRRVNLSIQLPNDVSSLLPTHTDVWSGDSPYEVVLWAPMVNCYATKSMWIMPDLATDTAVQARLAELGSMAKLEDEIRDVRVFLDVPFGKVVIFTPTMMHGNIVNTEGTTRWSFNCRFKSLLSPYADKKLGEFFEPITIRPATRIGMGHRQPGGF